MSASTSRPLTAGSPKVPHVEDLECGDGINHTLEHLPAGYVGCPGCGRSWAELDAEARA